MPIGILGSLVICTILYVAVTSSGLASCPRLNIPDPTAAGIDALGLGWLARIIKLGARFLTAASS